MNSYELNAKHLERKKGSIVYLKKRKKYLTFKFNWWISSTTQI